MLSRLANTLLEQHALIRLQIARAAAASEADVVARCRHVMRAGYAHLSAVKNQLMPALKPYVATEQLQAAIEAVALPLTIMAVADGTGRRDGLDGIAPSLDALLLIERSVLASSSHVSQDALEALAAAVEEHFEALYGREGQPSADWASSQF